jgi:hypothetical protein
MKRKPISKKEAVARTLEDVGEALETVLGFLEEDTAHLKNMGVQEGAVEFPWDARDRAITEMMLAVEGLKNRIRLIEAG